jgi:uncharacterized membrane protein YgdD (TMEM256/DUF423 family)
VTSDGRRFLVLACASLALATAFGAFGAHALQALLSPQRLRSFETAVAYQFFHSLGLLGIGLLLRDAAAPWLVRAGWMLVAGIVLFSGSIYALTFGAPRGVIALAPVGGVALMAAWVTAAVAVARQR